MKIAIFSIDTNDDVKNVIDKVFKLSINKNITFHIYSELYKSLRLKGHSLYNNHLDLHTEVDLMISIGGDGTFLRTLGIVRDKGIPILPFFFGLPRLTSRLTNRTPIMRMSRSGRLKINPGLIRTRSRWRSC